MNFNRCNNNCQRKYCYFQPTMAKERGLDIDHPITIPEFVNRFGCASYSNSLNEVTEFTKADIEKIITMLETCVISKNWDANIGVGPGDYAFGDIRIPANKVKAFCNALQTINFNRNIETLLKLPTTCNAADWTHEETMNRLQCTYDRGFEEGSSNTRIKIIETLEKIYDREYDSRPCNLDDGGHMCNRSELDLILEIQDIIKKNNCEGIHD